MGARARAAGIGPRSLGEGRGVVPRTVAREDGRCLATVAKEVRRGGDASGRLPTSRSRGLPPPRVRTTRREQPGLSPPGWEIAAGGWGMPRQR